MLVDWCGSLVSNELLSTEILWAMCNGMIASSVAERFAVGGA